MENHKTSCPKAVCEKIFRAVTFGPAFTTIRRIPSRHQTPSPTKHAQNPSRPNPTIKGGAEVPIKFDYTTRLPSPPTEKQKPITTLNGATRIRAIVPVQQAPNSSKLMAEKSDGQIEVEFERHQANEEEGEKPTQHHDDKFSVFIREFHLKQQSLKDRSE